jgi:hypothetical protein
LKFSAWLARLHAVVMSAPKQVAARQHNQRQ